LLKNENNQKALEMQKCSDKNKDIQEQLQQRNIDFEPLENQLGRINHLMTSSVLKLTHYHQVGWCHLMKSKWILSKN